MARKAFASGKFKMDEKTHTIILDDGYRVNLCDLRMQLRLTPTNAYTHISAQKMKTLGLKVRKDTYTTMFDRRSFENGVTFRLMFVEFCKWISEQEPLLFNEKACFFVDPRHPKQIAGMAFFLHMPDITHAPTMDAWSLLCTLDCNRKILTITKIKAAFERIPCDKMTPLQLNDLAAMLYWERTYRRVLGMVHHVNLATSAVAATSRVFK